MSQQKPLSLPTRKPKASPPPPPPRKRLWPTVLMAAILAGAGAWFWMNNEPGKRESVLTTAQDTVSELRKSLTETAAPTGRNAEQAQGQGPNQSPGQAQGQTPGQAQGQPEQNAEAQGQGPAPVPGPTPGSTPGSTSGPTAGQAQAQSQPKGQAAAPAGRAVAGSPPALAAPVPAGMGGNQSAWGIVSNEPQRPQDPGLAGRQDDAVVRPTFIDDLANWLVDNYVPANGRSGRSSIGIDIQSANARYGTGMKGLAWIGDDLSAGRAEALRYVYVEGMLEGLYRLYIERFMQAVAEAAEKPRKNGKTLEPAQIADMYRLYAGRLRTLSGAIHGVTALDDLRARVGRIQAASHKLMAANTRYMEEVFKYDQAREGGNQAQIEKTRTSMEAASDAYRQVSRERDQLRDSLVGAIRASPGARGFGEDNLLYVALWIDRRLQQSPQALDASREGAALLLELAQRFEHASGPRP